MEYTYKYPRPAVTADCVVITREAEPKVLLIQRGYDPLLSQVRMMLPRLSGGHYQHCQNWLSTMRKSWTMQ